MLQLHSAYTETVLLWLVAAFYSFFLLVTLEFISTAEANFTFPKGFLKVLAIHPIIHVSVHERNQVVKNMIST